MNPVWRTYFVKWVGSTTNSGFIQVSRSFADHSTAWTFWRGESTTLSWLYTRRRLQKAHGSLGSFWCVEKPWIRLEPSRSCALTSSLDLSRQQQKSLPCGSGVGKSGQSLSFRRFSTLFAASNRLGAFQNTNLPKSSLDSLLPAGCPLWTTQLHLQRAAGRAADLWYLGETPQGSPFAPGRCGCLCREGCGRALRRSGGCVEWTGGSAQCPRGLDWSMKGGGVQGCVSCRFWNFAS